MTLKDLITADSKSVFLNTDDFAVDAVLNCAASGIVNKAIKAIIEYNTKLAPQEWGSADTAVIHVAAADYPNPVVYGKITIDTVVWGVQMRITGDRAGMWALSCTTDRRQVPQGAG